MAEFRWRHLSNVERFLCNSRACCYTLFQCRLLMKDKSGRQETVIIQDSVNTDTVIKKNTAFFGAGGRGTAIGTR